MDTTQNVHTEKAENIALQTFEEHERKKLATCKVFTLVVIGDTGAGKTSLVKYDILNII